jgi:hypothetical protein
VSAPTLIATAVVGKKEDKDMAKEVPNITIDSPRGSDRVGTSQSAPSASTPSSEKKVAFNLELHKTSSELDASSHEESDDVCRVTLSAFTTRIRTRSSVPLGVVVTVGSTCA